MNLINNDIFIFYGLLVVIIIQRFFEMDMSSKNEIALKSKYRARVISTKESSLVKLFHSLWFVALFIESWFFGSIAKSSLLITCYIVIFAAQGLRFLSMKELGEYWTIRIMMIKGQFRINSGVIKYLKHPSYIAVVLEFIFVPLVFNCYFTLVVFSLCNLYVIAHRIKLEEKLLARVPAYIESKTRG